MKLINTAMLTVALSLSAMTTQAKEYLTLDVGEASLAEIKSQLKSVSAQFDSNYGYKGYTDLPMIKVERFPAFDKHGSVQSAWLYFTPDKTLYKVDVTYSDAGRLHTMFRDALNSKYERLAVNNHGFNKKSVYRDGDFEITLSRNEFGFGSDQKTQLTYVFSPSLGDVRSMEQLIEQVIRDKNAQKAGDL
jgi:hypothetical protein